jgi:hypothetical protein
VSGTESYPPPGASGDEPPAQGTGQPPPPGWQPPPPTQPYPAQPYPQQPYPQPGYAPPGYPPQYASQYSGQHPGPYPPQPGMLGAAHKPGAIALRPLQLGDMYDAAFRIIRFNPKATVGSAVLVTAVAMLIPVVVTAVLTWSVNLSLDPGSDGFTGAEAAGLVGALGSLLLGTLLQSLGLILVTGMVAHVTMAAAVGKKLTLGEAWAATAGKRLKLVGLVFLLGLMLVLLIALFVLTWVAGVVALDSGAAIALFLLVSIPAFLLALWWFWIRIYYLPVPALMLEDVGVFGAIERGHALTRKVFWRVFGIALLTAIITSIAGPMLGVPVTMVMDALLSGGLDSQYAALSLTLVNAVSSVVQAAFVAPFTAAVTSLQYVDQRIRKEAFDVELMTRAGITAR